jgi:hypothetical protein
MLYVVNGKSSSGPNPGYLPVPNRCYFKSRNTNQFVEALQQSSLLSFSVPDGETLAQLSRVVAENNSFGSTPNRRNQRVMAALRQRIKHVIYVIKENRTYDQILGDLDRGNGDPRLTEFGEQITPNFHHFAQQFVDLDNFYDSGDVSGDGWAWSTAGRETDFGRKSVPLYYSGRGTTTTTKAPTGMLTLVGRRFSNVEVRPPKISSFLILPKWPSSKITIRFFAALITPSPTTTAKTNGSVNSSEAYARSRLLGSKDCGVRLHQRR